MDRGLAAGHTQEGKPLLGDGSGAASLLGGFCRLRRTTDGGDVLVPMLIVCRKTAMRLFCGGKKGRDHDDSVMAWGAKNGTTLTMAVGSSSCYLIKLEPL